MATNTFEDTLESFAKWREQLIRGIGLYYAWREKNKFGDISENNALMSVVQDLIADRITLAFVAEFSRGKTELINALFFSDTGVRLLPSTPGRTTMCPTELFYDESQGNYIRLLPIETRLQDETINQLKQQQELWTHLPLDADSPQKMQAVFKELLAVKRVPKAEAIKLCLYNEDQNSNPGTDLDETVEIPQWRHALISFPHSLFKKGLTILDTPGLNALGSEPELTLSMLPNAQALIFVVAADTGVTKSDLEIWTTHTNKTIKQGLAVVLNKIDSLWGDILSGEDDYQVGLNNQIKNAATVLGLEPSNIFPVSAKQALIAKVQGDPDLLERSNIKLIEKYLCHDILLQRRQILMEIILREIGFYLKESTELIERNYRHSHNQYEEFKQMDYENQEMIAKLIEETQIQEKTYADNFAQLKKSNLAFEAKFQELLNSLSRSRVTPLLKDSKKEMISSISTFGMKHAMKQLFNDLNAILQESVGLSKETRMLVNDVHYQFNQRFGFSAVEPELFSIDPYQKELERIFAEFENYRQSAEVTFTEQSIVVKKLYGTLILEVWKVQGDAKKAASSWGKNAMMPLMHQLNEYKKQIESRFAILRSFQQSKNNYATTLKRLQRELELISSQRNELYEIVRLFEL